MSQKIEIDLSDILSRLHKAASEVVRREVLPSTGGFFKHIKAFRNIFLPTARGAKSPFNDLIINTAIDNETGKFQFNKNGTYYIIIFAYGLRSKKLAEKMFNTYIRHFSGDQTLDLSAFIEKDNSFNNFAGRSSKIRYNRVIKFFSNMLKVEYKINLFSGEHIQSTLDVINYLQKDMAEESKKIEHSSDSILKENNNLENNNIWLNESPFTISSNENSKSSMQIIRAIENNNEDLLKESMTNSILNKIKKNN